MNYVHALECRLGQLWTLTNYKKFIQYVPNLFQEELVAMTERHDLELNGLDRRFRRRGHGI